MRVVAFGERRIGVVGNDETVIDITGLLEA